MEGILTFTLPEERSDFKIASNAGELHSAVWEFAQWLRNREKYGGAHNEVELQIVRAAFNNLVPYELLED